MSEGRGLAGLLSISQFSNRMGVALSTTYWHAKNGSLPGQVEVMGRVYVPVKVVEAIERGDADIAQLLGQVKVDA